MSYDSTKETMKHIHTVQQYGEQLMENMDFFFEHILVTDHQQDFYNWFKRTFLKQLASHDESKLSGEEKVGFDKWTPELAKYEYSTDPNSDYMKNLKKMLPFVKMHWSVNRHHPEHFKNGIRGMDLIDVFEMLCDWLAATKRNKNGDIDQSIENNKGRFDFDDATALYMKSTIPLMVEKVSDLDVFMQSKATLLNTLILQNNGSKTLSQDALEQHKSVYFHFMKNTIIRYTKESEK